MKLYEIRNQDTDTITRDILDISRIAQRLALFVEFLDNGVATYDFEYLTATAHKTKTMLAVADQILQSYVTESTRNENKSKTNDIEFVLNKGVKNNVKQE